MSKLVTATTDARETFRTDDRAEIARALARDGIRFERWEVRALAPDAGPPEILRTYAADIERVSAAGRYPCVDAVRMRRDPSDATWPEKARAAREKFLSEHIHLEDEVRFFVEGAGLFYLRLGERVHMVLCTAGDLISVPAGTRHWFDMGREPLFCAIRFFGTNDGWVASSTGDPIATRFPDFDAVVAS